MGHMHLGVLPRSRRWRQVVELLADGAADRDVVAASARAAERDLLRASGDAVFVEAQRLLLAIPHAARSVDFGDALRREGLAVGSGPHLLDLVTAATGRLDEMGQSAGRGSDISELAARALASTLSQKIGDALPGLFAATPEDVQAVTRGFSGAKGISVLNCAFFSTLVSTTLSYWLDRVLATHVGPDRRFADARDRAAFDRALDHFSAEATRIVKEFSGGWYGKTLRDHGSIDSDAARRFGAVCLKKIVAELRERWPADA